MTEWTRVWWPNALSQVKTQASPPAGFKSFSFVGSGNLSGLSCEMMEPHELASPADWLLLTSELEVWGDVPNPESITFVSTSEGPRGLNATLRNETEWVAEFLPWGSDGLFRSRCEAAAPISNSPIGGYTHNGSDVIMMRMKSEGNQGQEAPLLSFLESGDLISACEELYKRGALLGKYHKIVEEVRTTPPDPRRWNERLASIEEGLRADSIWRAPHSRRTQCMLSLGDVRLTDLSKECVNIGRPRFADALFKPNCEFPAIRDLAAVTHDLSRIHFDCECQLDIVELRSSLIDGWRSTAPGLWCSEQVFYTHRGGLAIWEYEQCLLDVIEAVSNQSGAPEPAVTLIGHVRAFQKRMFNNRTIGALSFMAAFFAATTLVTSPPSSLQEMVIPIAFFSSSYALLRYYRSLSPGPEVPFTRFS